MRNKQEVTEHLPEDSAQLDSRQTRIIIAMFFGGFSTFAQLYCMQSLLPLLSDQFLTTPSQSSLAISAATLTLGVCMLAASILAEGVSRKKLMAISLLTSSVLTVGAAFSPNFNTLVILSALRGLMMAGLPAIAMTYLSEEVKPSLLSRSMGLYIGGNIMGGMSGRVIVAWIADWTSWHVALASIGVICFLMAIAFIKLLPASENFSPGKIQPRRSLCYAINHLKDPTLVSLYLIISMAMGTFISLYNYLGFHLSEPPFLLSHAAIGTIFIMYTAGIAGSFGVGWLTDRLGQHRLLWGLITAMLIGLLLNLISNLALIILGLALFTLCFFGAHTVASSWVGRHIREGRAVGTALYLFSYYISSSLIGSFSGVILHRYGWSYFILLLVMLLSIAILLALYLYCRHRRINH